MKRRIKSVRISKVVEVRGKNIKILKEFPKAKNSDIKNNMK